MRRILSVLLVFVSLFAMAQPAHKPSSHLRGDEELARFIENNFVYPEGEKKKEQTFQVEFTLYADGKVTFDRIARPKGATHQMQRSMMRVFQQIDSWTPSNGIRPQRNGRGVYAIQVRINPDYHWNGDVVTLNKLKAGTLEHRLTSHQFVTTIKLKLNGELNAADIRTIRRMAGTHTEQGPKGRLEYLDLSRAKIVDDKAPYLELDAAREHMMARVIVYDQSSSQYSRRTGVANREEYDRAFWEGGNTFRVRFYLNDAGRKGKLRTLSPYEKTQWVDFSQRDLGRTWEKIKLSGLRRVKGHHVKMDKQTGRYIYRSYPRKNVIATDMFYACPSLKAVVMPWNSEVDDQVEVDFATVELLR